MAINKTPGTFESSKRINLTDSECTRRDLSVVHRDDGLSLDVDSAPCF